MDIDISLPVTWRLDVDWFIQQLQDTENGQLKVILPALDAGSCETYKELKLYLRWVENVLYKRINAEEEPLQVMQLDFIRRRASKFLGQVKDCLKEGYRGRYYREKGWPFEFGLPLETISHPDGNWVLRA